MANNVKKDNEKKEVVKEKNVKKAKKTSPKKHKEGYLKQVRKELKLVIWPKFKEVMKYTVATVGFCILLVVFFLLLNLLMSFIKGLFI